MTMDNGFTREEQHAYFHLGLCPFCRSPDVCLFPWGEVDAFTESHAFYSGRSRFLHVLAAHLRIGSRLIRASQVPSPQRTRTECVCWQVDSGRCDTPQNPLVSGALLVFHAARWSHQQRNDRRKYSRIPALRV